MNFLPPSGPASFPARSLSKAPNFTPDWRWLTAEIYLVEISKASDKNLHLEGILTRESDPYIKRLLEFHCGRRRFLNDPFDYAFYAAAGVTAKTESPV